MDMLENFEIKEDAPRYKERAFFFALPYQGRAQLFEPPGSVEEKLLAHITWIRDNLHLLNDNSISDDDWIKYKEDHWRRGGCSWVYMALERSARRRKL
jgi:hypothetical protein